MAAPVTRKGPRMGRKQVFLPDFVLALLRTPKLPPTFASFIVPLHLNKLDLRDYLYNVYGIEALNVRSFIQMQKLRQDRPNAIRTNPRRWFRPKSIKKMTVEMAAPFVWPPEDVESETDKMFREVREKEYEEAENTMDPAHRKKPSSEIGPIARQARALLRGQEWSSITSTSGPAEASTDPEMSQTWEDDVEEVEVEKDQKLPPKMRGE